MNVTDKTVLITGATDGVGKLVALRLAAAGARVLLHGRNKEKGAAVLRAIRDETGNDRLEYYQADFSSIDETRRLAEAIEAEHDRLELLINNAGIGSTTRGKIERETSRDGHELRFAVNYLAPFLLTHLLLPLVLKSAPARIVNVASAGQQGIDFSDVMLTRGYDGFRAYCQSKLALVMFTFDIAEETKGSGVRGGRSSRRSAESSGDGQEREDTTTVGAKQSDLEIELSILQSNYEKCLNFGLKARAIPTQTIDGKQPVLVIQMLNVGRCPTCGSWIVGWTCPTC